MASASVVFYRVLNSGDAACHSEPYLGGKDASMFETVEELSEKLSETGYFIDPRQYHDHAQEAEAWREYRDNYADELHGNCRRT